MTAVRALRAGGTITWVQHSQAGAGWAAPFTRAGIVWSPAVTGEGVSSAWWVHPDVPRASDIYHVTYVGRASRRDPYHAAGPAKGEIYSSDQPQDITCVRAVRAWQAAQAVKAARKAATRAGYAPAA